MSFNLWLEYRCLQQGRDEPDASTAMTITGDSDTDLECGKYNHGPQVRRVE